MTNTLNICRTQEGDLKRRAGEALSKYLAANVDKRVLFLASGGSALKVLDYIDSQALGENLTVSVLDERLHVDKKDSNFSQLLKTDFCAQAKGRGAAFIEPNEWPLHVTGSIIVALMGIGPDGHTAGVMPFSKEPFESTESIVEYEANNKFPHRLTATISFIKNHVDFAVVYVAGEEKREALEHILASHDDLTRYPARVIHHMKHLELYTHLT